MLAVLIKYACVELYHGGTYIDNLVQPISTRSQAILVGYVSPLQ